MGPHLGARSPSPKTDSRAPRQHQALGPALGPPTKATSPARLGPLC